MSVGSLNESVSSFLEQAGDTKYGLTLKQLYLNFMDYYKNSCTYSTFKKIFYSSDKGSLIYDRSKRVWVQRNATKDTNKNYTNEPLMSYVQTLIHESLSEYFQAIIDCELQDLMRPILKELVKEEFETKVIPSVVKNLENYVEGILNKKLSDCNFINDLNKLKELIEGFSEISKRIG